MSRVYPLPSALRKIIDLFCPAHLRNNPSITAHKSHLARILLGRSIPDPGRVAPQRFFHTYNFPLTHDRAELLGIDVMNMAIEMGRLLAQMHMKAKNDARGELDKVDKVITVLGDDGTCQKMLDDVLKEEARQVRAQSVAKVRDWLCT